MIDCVIKENGVLTAYYGKLGLFDLSDCKNDSEADIEELVYDVIEDKIEDLKYQLKYYEKKEEVCCSFGQKEILFNLIKDLCMYERLYCSGVNITYV